MLPLLPQPSEEITFTVWDMKGGDNYALVHQTLFTPHALYVLVWDIGDREAGIEKLRPWLLNIQVRIIRLSHSYDFLDCNFERVCGMCDQLPKFIETKAGMNVEKIRRDLCMIKFLSDILFFCTNFALIFFSKNDSF